MIDMDEAYFTAEVFFVYRRALREGNFMFKMYLIDD